jgi:hypothetical protein
MQEKGKLDLAVSGCEIFLREKNVRMLWLRAGWWRCGAFLADSVAVMYGVCIGGVSRFGGSVGWGWGVSCSEVFVDWPD